MATKTTHVHKLKRIKYKSGNQVFFCALPDCNYKTNIALALGKRSLCWRCGEGFVMNEYSLRLAKPHCENCHKSKNGMLRREEIPSNTAMTLAERLQNTINNVQSLEPEDEI